MPDICNTMYFFCCCCCVAAGMTVWSLGVLLMRVRRNVRLIGGLFGSNVLKTKMHFKDKLLI